MQILQEGNQCVAELIPEENVILLFHSIRYVVLTAFARVYANIESLFRSFRWFGFSGYIIGNSTSVYYILIERIDKLANILLENN